MQLVSVSKDALGKVWDLSTQHCVQTLTGHRSEVWSVSVSADGTRILTGAADRQLRVWAVGSQAEDGEGVATYMGSVLREGTDRCLSIKYVGPASIALVFRWSTRPVRLILSVAWGQWCRNGANICPF